MTKTSTRQGRTKLSVTYEGFLGYTTGNKFDGFLPPHPNVRIFRLSWLNRGPGDTPRVEHNPRSQIEHTEMDLDYDPLPTQKTIEADFIPCVVAIFRDIVREYAESDELDRNRTWHKVLSACKFSLAADRQASSKRRRRRPIQLEDSDNAVSYEEKQDQRAIKKSFRLIREGCSSKATKVLDQETRPNRLSDSETLEKLELLHPKNASNIRVPSDAPFLTSVSTEELRSAGRRLSKGATPGPTGMTDTVLKILLDDEVCCRSFCHMEQTWSTECWEKMS